MTSQTISKIDTTTRAADKPIDHQSAPTAAVIETTMTTPPTRASSFVSQHHGVVWGFISVVTALAIWWAVTATGLVPSLFLPNPTSVWQQFVKVSTEGYMSATLIQHTFASLGRVFIALVLAVVVGVPIAIWMGTNRTVQAIFDPLLEFYRPIPPHLDQYEFLLGYAVKPMVMSHAKVIAMGSHRAIGQQIGGFY